MVLSDGEIKKYLKKGKLFISPLDEKSIQPASVDIRLGSSFSVARNNGGVVGLGSRLEYDTVETNEYILYPGQFVLGTTMEYFCLPNDLTAFVEGRSSIGRLGLFIQNAGWTDPGFQGEITLELYNASQMPILLQTGVRVGQMVFAKTGKAALNPYSGKYQGQTGATGSRLYMDVGE